jgi:uncharacterized repeat protein (TIGR03809 family)
MSKPPLLVSVQTVEKWLTLAQRRCAYFEELHESGRWRRMYSEQSALQAAMHNAVQDAENWANLLRVVNKEATGSDYSPVDNVASDSPART